MCQVCRMLNEQVNPGAFCSVSASEIAAATGMQGAAPAVPVAQAIEAATSGTVGASGNIYVDGVLIGTRWTSNVNYSFPVDATPYLVGGFYADSVTGITAVSATQMSAVRKILETGPSSFEGVSGIGITEVASNNGPSGSDIMIAQCNNYGGQNLSTARVADFPDAIIYPNFPTAAGDVWFGDDGSQYRNPILGNYAWATHIHELGHAFGLKHGHSPDGIISALQVVLPSAFDSMEYSIMTYRSYVGASTTGGYRNETFGYAQTLMMFDIAALQYLYGADFTTNSGNSTYQWNSATGEMTINGVGQGTPGANRVFLTVWDGGGVDTYDMSNYGGGSTIDLRPGAYSITASGQRANLGDGNFARGNVFNAMLYQGDLRSIIENAVGGAGNDSLIGNEVGNSLNGGGGANQMWGFGGNDFLTATGNLNVADGDDGNDQLFFTGNQNQLYGDVGNDWLGVNGTNNALVGGDGNEVWIGATGNSNTLDGQGGHDALFANGTGNNLYGSAGNDWLGCSGTSNTLLGGAGSEWMGVSGGSNAANGGEGNDTLLSVGSNILYGENGDDWLGCSGNNNYMAGMAGNDYVAATGNNNTLDGGTGNDTLVAAAGNVGTRFVFGPGYGQDTIHGFKPGAGATDIVDLRGFGLTFTNLLNLYASDSAGGVVINLGGGSILTLAGVAEAQLTAGDFLLA